MVRHDWMTRMYRWMAILEKLVNIIIKLMEGWKTRLEVTEDGKALTSKTINIRTDLLQRDSYSAEIFCLKKKTVSILIEKTYGYTMGQRDKETEKKNQHEYWSVLQSKEMWRNVSF